MAAGQSCVRRRNRRVDQNDPLYGRCPRGERLVAPVPWGHWKTATFIGALRQDGLVAPCAFDGPINGEKFRAWVEQFLVPELKPGDIVILENLPGHKVEGVKLAKPHWTGTEAVIGAWRRFARCGAWLLSGHSGL